MQDVFMAPIHVAHTLGFGPRAWTRALLHLLRSRWAAGKRWRECSTRGRAQTVDRQGHGMIGVDNKMSRVFLGLAMDMMLLHSTHSVQTRTVLIMRLQ